MSFGMNRFGRRTPPAGRQEQELVLGDRGLERRGPDRSRQSGSSAVEADRVDHRAGEDVGADLGALLDHDDGDLAARLGGELLQADGGGKAGRPRAHDDHVEFHRLAGA